MTIAIIIGSILSIFLWFIPFFGTLLVGIITGILTNSGIKKGALSGFLAGFIGSYLIYYSFLFIGEDYANLAIRMGDDLLTPALGSGFYSLLGGVIGGSRQSK